MNYQVPHAEWTDKIVAKLSGDLSPTELAALQGHLHSCAACMQALEDYEMMMACVSMVAADDPQPHLPARMLELRQEISMQSKIAQHVSSDTIDVLLVTTSDVETKAVLRVVQKSLQQKTQASLVGNNTYFDLGRVNSARVAMVQTGKRSGGPQGAILTINEGIKALSPSAVIMVGIAFGFDNQMQHVGDILVSQQIKEYEPQKLGSNPQDLVPTTISQGDRCSASARLLNMFRAGALSWSGPRIHYGLILSGEKLVNDAGFRDKLHEVEPEAIGGEMEGAGLYAAAQRNKVDWILVKAISDWVGGIKLPNIAQNHQRAAENAARFTMHVLQQVNLRGSKADLTLPMN